MANRVKDGSRVSDYEYELPPGRIARYPTERRDQSRLLVVPPGGEPFEHRVFSDLVDLLSPGDVLVVNESRVRPARLLGRKPTGAPSEILLLRPVAGTEAPEDPRVGSGSAGAAGRDEATLWRPGAGATPIACSSIISGPPPPWR